MAAVGMAVGCLQRRRLVRSGHARVLSELIEVAVWGAEVHLGVPAVIDPRFEEDLHSGGSQLGDRAVDVVDQEAGDGAGGEVAVDITVATKDLDLAAVRQLQHPQPGSVQLKWKAQQVAEEGHGNVHYVANDWC